MRKSIMAMMGAVALLVAGASQAEPLPGQIEGWSITPTPHSWQVLGERVTAAIDASPLNKLSQASATMGAKSLGETIAGNLVIDAFAPQFAVRMLEASVAAGIEAPLRLYITENADGTATLAYKLPSTVFAAYADGGEALATLAGELDVILMEIASAAIAP